MQSFGFPAQEAKSGAQVPTGWLKAAGWFFSLWYSKVIKTTAKISIAAKIKNIIFVGIWNFTLLKISIIYGYVKNFDPVLRNFILSIL
jgi:hypothetical protein